MGGGWVRPTGAAAAPPPAARFAPPADYGDEDDAPRAIVELCSRRGPVVRPTPAVRQVAPIFLPRAAAAAKPGNPPPPAPRPGKVTARPAKAAAKPGREEMREVTVLDRRDGRFYYVRADGTREARDGSG